jgi:hypothetical protein
VLVLTLPVAEVAMQEVTLPSLWLPIVLSAVIVFIASSIVWMALKYENAEWKPIPGEDQLREVLRKLNLAAPAQYTFPHMAGEGGVAGAMKRMEEGPNGILLLRPAQKFSMTPQLVQAFVFYLVVSFFAGYVASHALAWGADYLRVFQIVGPVGFMAYGFALVPEAVWFGRTWKSVCKSLFSALIYGCLTAGTFGWLWPR